jgi:Family of unknown function (DUF6502)
MDKVKGPTLAQSRRRAFETLRPLIHVLRACGISEGILRCESERAYRRYARTSSRGVWTDRAEFRQLARVLTVWSRDPAFIDEAGSPRRLTLGGGTGSFAALLRKARVSMAVEEVLADLRALGSVRRCGRGRVRLASSVLPGILGTRVLAAPILDAVRRFTEAVEHDLCDGQTAERRMHRWAGSTRVDPRQLPEVQRFVSSCGETFLDAVQDKLLACAIAHRGGVWRADERRRTRKGRRYAVGVYVYLDDAGERGAGRRRRRSAHR